MRGRLNGPRSDQPGGHLPLSEPAALITGEGTRGKTATPRKENVMAVKRHVRGASSKEQRQYEHIKKSARKSGRYGKRAKEVAARTVMKQHRKKKKSRSRSRK